MRYYIQDSSGRKYGVESNISSAKQRARILSGSQEKTLSVVDINNETTAKFRNGMQIRHNPPVRRKRTRMNGQIDLKTYGVGTKAFVDTFSGLIPCKVIEVRKPGSGKSVTEGEIVVKLTKTVGAYKKGEILVQAASKIVPRSHIRRRGGALRINTLYRFNPNRKTKRNSTETVPVKKSYWKWIAGAGVVLAALYILRRRTQTAVLPQTFPTTPMTPVLSAPRVGQSFAQAAQIMRQSNTPYRIVQQDGRALATTKDRNLNRWNLVVNRGVIVRAYKG